MLAEIKRHLHYRHSSRENPRRITRKPTSKLTEAEKNLIALAAQSKEALVLVKENMHAEDFSLPEAKTIADLLFTTDFEDNVNLTHFLLDNLPNEEAKKFLSRSLVSEHLAQADKTEKILNDCINVIKSERQKSKIEDLKLEIKEAEKLGQTEKVEELLSALKSEIS